MAKLSIKKGSTDVTLNIFIQDSASTTGAGKTGLVYNTTNLVCYYVRPGSAAAALTLATQTVDGAHSDGGFKEIDATNMPGVYRLDLSDAIVAAGVNSATVMLKGATGMAPLLLELELVDYTAKDIYDIVNSETHGNSALKTLIDGVPTTAEFEARTLAAAGYFDPATDKVTVATNEDKTGYGLADNAITAAKIAGDAITAAKVAADVTTEIQSGLATSTEVNAIPQGVWNVLTTALTTVGSIGKYLLDHIIGHIIGVLDTGTHKPQSGDAYAVVNHGTYGNSALKTLVDGKAPASTALSNTTWTDTKAGYLDAAVSSRLASTGYTAPDNAGVAAIKGVTDKLNTAMEADTGVYRFTENALEMAPAGGGTSAPTVEEIRAEMETAGGHLALILEDTSTTLDGKIDSLQAGVNSVAAKTNRLTFSSGNNVDANTKEINSMVVIGDGGRVRRWGAPPP